MVLWPNLSDFTLDKNKEFIRQFFELDIEGKLSWFDKLDGKIQREDDPDMTLDTYLSNMSESTQIRFIVGREEYFGDERVPAISMCLRSHFKGTPGSSFAWCKYPFDESYEKVDEIFQRVYDMPIVVCKRL